MEVDDTVVVQIGRWILFSNGEWDFKLDTSRQGRCVRLSRLGGLQDLDQKVRGLYGMESSTISVEFSYIFEDNLALWHGIDHGPTLIGDERQFRCFRSLSMADKSVNLYVCFRDKDGNILGGVENALNPKLQEKGAVIKKVGYFQGLISSVQGIEQKNELARTLVGDDISEEDLIRQVEDVESKLGYDSNKKRDDDDSLEAEFIRQVEEMEAMEAKLCEDSRVADGRCEDHDEYSNLTLDDTDEDDFDDDDDEDDDNAGDDDDDEDNVVDEPNNDEEPDDSDDDFVVPPQSKKVKGKRSMIFAECLAERLTQQSFKKGISIDEIYGYEDIEPMFADTDMDSKASHVDLTKEDDAMYVGRTFGSREDFRIALSIYAINRVFRFRFTRYEKKYLVAQCYDKKGCDWRVVGHQIGDSEEYDVRKAKLSHVCNVETRSKFSKHATSKVVAALLRSKYANAYSGPRARDLPDCVLAEHNVNLTYWKAWKAKELAVVTAQGTEESSYRLLPVYLHVLQLANPGTIYHLETETDEKGDERFKYVFLTLGASVQGLNYLRRVVVVDGTHLFGKYKGCLLTASCQDANFQIFPVAFAVVDSENDDSWVWFMKKLTEIVEDGADLSFVSDRNTSINKALADVYPEAHHGACLVHLRRNVKTKYLKKSGLPSLVWRAGTRYRLKDFDVEYQRIKSRNIECWKYLDGIGVENWSRVHFKGNRYNLMSSNIAESLNKALLPARGSPVVALLEFVRKMLGRWFNARRKKISKTQGDVPKGVEKELFLRLKGSLGMKAYAVGLWDYEVVTKRGDQFHVSLQHNTYSCKEFQTLNIPCTHAMAAADDRDLEFRTLVGDMHRISMWSKTIEGSILPVQDPEEVDVPEDIRIMCLMPPKTKRPPGRPPKLRIHSGGEAKTKSQQPNKCGRCGGLGHNRVTCKNPLG